MKENKVIQKIDGFQLTALLVTLVAATAVLFDPVTTTKVAGHDGWLGIIIVTVNGAGLLYILYRLSTLFPGQTLIEYLPLIVGKIAGKIIGLGYILVFVTLTAGILNEALLFFYGTGIFSLTPPLLIGVVIVISTTYGVYAGIETISRTLSLYWLVLGGLYVVFILLAIPSMDFKALLPVGEAGWSDILKSSMLPHGLRGELFLLAMLWPYCRSNREGHIAGQIANILIGVIIIITIIACVASLGPETTSRATFGPFFLADYIQPIGIKIALVTIWTIAFWGKITLLQFTLADGIEQLLGLKEHKPLILPMAIILLIFSQTSYWNETDFREITDFALPGMMLFFGYLIPALLLIIALIKARLQAQSESSPHSLPGPN